MGYVYTPFSLFFFTSCIKCAQSVILVDKSLMIDSEYGLF